MNHRRGGCRVKNGVERYRDREKTEGHNLTKTVSKLMLDNYYTEYVVHVLCPP